MFNCSVVVVVVSHGLTDFKFVLVVVVVVGVVVLVVDVGTL